MARLKFGMVGGGSGAFIGAVHRRAATLDGEADFLAGALSSTPERAKASALELGLAPDRSYGTWQEMLERELARPPHERIDYVSIVTPNHAHYPVARAFADAGFHVVCDKPLVHTSAQANELARLAEARGIVFAVTYNYTGYPLVRHARELVAQGAIGTVRKVFAEYHQGWLATLLEGSGQKQASWRTDPTRAGAGAVGDIGSHAENLASTITGLEIESLCADVSTFVPGRAIDDDAAILLRFHGGAKGIITCSQVCVGCENSLSIRVYGSEGALEWRQEQPNSLVQTSRDQPPRVLTRGGPGLGDAAASATRLPSGHPEGFHEAFANIYRGVHAHIRARRANHSGMSHPDQGQAGEAYPDVRAGARGVRFIEKVLESGRAGGVWVKCE